MTRIAAVLLAALLALLVWVTNTPAEQPPLAPGLSAIGTALAGVHLPAHGGGIDYADSPTPAPTETPSPVPTPSPPPTRTPTATPSPAPTVIVICCLPTPTPEVIVVPVPVQPAQPPPPSGASESAITLPLPPDTFIPGPLPHDPLPTPYPAIDLRNPPVGSCLYDKHFPEGRTELHLVWCGTTTDVTPPAGR